MPADAPDYFGRFRIRVSPVLIRKKYSNIQKLLKTWMGLFNDDAIGSVQRSPALGTHYFTI